MKIKVGDLVRFAPDYRSPGEEKYISKVIEINDHTGNILISVLNTKLTLGSTEMVKEYMIEKIEEEEK